MKNNNCVRKMGRYGIKIPSTGLPAKIMPNGSLFPYNKINLRYLHHISK